jgi:DNA-binding HxlR family transcriptional regulator
MTFEAVPEVLGKKRTLEVLCAVEEWGPARYSTIDEAVGTSSDVITDRLQILVGYGLLTRREKNERNVTYELTTRGDAVIEYLREVEVLLTRGAESRDSTK